MGSDMKYDSDLRMFTQGKLDKKKRKHAHERWTKVIQKGTTWESDNLESTFDQVLNSVSNSDYVTVTNVAVKEFTREIKASTVGSLPSAIASVTKSITSSGLDVALATAMLLPPTLAIMDSFRSLHGVQIEGKKRKVKESEVVSVKHNEIAFAWATEKQFMGGDVLAINVLFVKITSLAEEFVHERMILRDLIKQRGDTKLVFKQASFAVDIEDD